jgi:hypothetical protein
MRLAYESQRESALDRTRWRAMRLQHILDSYGRAFEFALSNEDVEAGDFDEAFEESGRTEGSRRATGPEVRLLRLSSRAVQASRLRVVAGI